MLQMDCPKCKGVTKSLFLADLSTVECHQCKEIIPVKDVFITTKHFTIHREDFVSRNFRFQKLLREVEKELHLMANNKEASTKSKESLNLFYSSLQELLVGARDSYRLELPCDLYVEVTEKDRNMKGRLVNLSTKGGSIEFVGLDKVPRKKSELRIDFSFPELSENLCIQARVVWTKEQMDSNGTLRAIAGITFTYIDENTRNCIWNYILDHAPVPLQQASK
jgi:hypothetical protein